MTEDGRLRQNHRTPEVRAPEPQKTEDRGQRAETRMRNVEFGMRRTEDRGQRPEDCVRTTEHPSEDRKRRTENRSQASALQG